MPARPAPPRPAPPPPPPPPRNFFLKADPSMHKLDTSVQGDEGGHEILSPM